MSELLTKLTKMTKVFYQLEILLQDQFNKLFTLNFYLDSKVATFISTAMSQEK